MHWTHESPLMTATSSPTFYEILDIPVSRGEHADDFPKGFLKTAYHRALLLHHPDKTAQTLPALQHDSQHTRHVKAKYSIDEIVLAYQTLSDVQLRRKYDAQLLTSNDVNTNKSAGIDRSGTHLGVEAFDLDDLKYNEAEHSWSKACRCGSETGYLVAEEELEKESETGELYVGCHGCSLFIKVLFGTTEEA